MGSEMLNPRVKTLNYLNNVLAKIEANNANAPEALMLNDDGFVVEATGDNIFIVRHGALLTPPTWIGALRGITRDTVIEIAHSMELPVREEPFTRYQIITADEAFLTGTAAEVIPVTRIDARDIGDGRPGPITRTLIKRFRSLVTTDGEQF
jgi:branched-chain amino acid aminotransferase